MKLKKLGTALLASTIMVNMAVPVNVSAAYNRNNAATYAKKHAKNYNPSYDKFDADCTNFVSQCVAAGGVPKKVFQRNKLSIHILEIYLRQKIIGMRVNGR